MKFLVNEDVLSIWIRLKFVKMGLFLDLNKIFVGLILWWIKFFEFRCVRVLVSGIVIVWILLGDIVLFC